MKSIEADEPTKSDGKGKNQIEKGGKLEREDELGFFLSNGEGTEKKMFRNILLGKFKKKKKIEKKRKEKEIKTPFQLFSF